MSGKEVWHCLETYYYDEWLGGVAYSSGPRPADTSIASLLPGVDKKTERALGTDESGACTSHRQVRQTRNAKRVAKHPSNRACVEHA